MNYTVLIVAIILVIALAIALYFWSKKTKTDYAHAASTYQTGFDVAGGGGKDLAKFLFL